MSTIVAAIEKIIKDELNLSVGSKPSQNQDIVFEETVKSSAGFQSSGPPELKADDDDDYWSDFSDDIYTQEIIEEKKAADTLISLQRWHYSSNIEKDIKKKFPNSSILSLDEFKDCLIDAGFYCDLIDIESLLKRLQIKDNEGIDCLEFFANLQDRNAAWWKDYLKNTSFDLTYKGKRNGNYRPL